MSKVLIFLIRLYQVTLSPWLGNSCRFYPSCSCYAIEALRAHGCLKGAWLGMRRLLKCQPLHAGGFDPVPLNPRQSAGLTSAYPMPSQSAFRSRMKQPKINPRGGFGRQHRSTA